MDNTKLKHRRKGKSGCISFFIALLVGLGVAVTYGLMPIDLIPEVFLGPFGYLDDLILTLGSAYITYQRLRHPKKD